MKARRAKRTKYGEKPRGVEALPLYAALTRHYLSKPDPVAWAALADLFAEHGDEANSDALEEAGCDWEALLRHLRGVQECRACGGAGAFRSDGLGECVACGYEGVMPLPGPHVRGCWALDLILGKE